MRKVEYAIGPHVDHLSTTETEMVWTHHLDHQGRCDKIECGIRGRQKKHSEENIKERMRLELSHTWQKAEGREE